MPSRCSTSSRRSIGRSWRARWRRKWRARIAGSSSTCQVNIGEEPQKAGIAPRDADAFIALCRNELGLDDRRPDVHPAARSNSRRRTSRCCAKSPRPATNCPAFKRRRRRAEDTRSAIASAHNPGARRHLSLALEPATPPTKAAYNRMCRCSTIKLRTIPFDLTAFLLELAWIQAGGRPATSAWGNNRNEEVTMAQRLWESAPRWRRASMDQARRGRLLPDRAGRLRPEVEGHFGNHQNVDRFVHNAEVWFKGGDHARQAMVARRSNSKVKIRATRSMKCVRADRVASAACRSVRKTAVGACPVFPPGNRPRIRLLAGVLGLER